MNYGLVCDEFAPYVACYWATWLAFKLSFKKSSYFFPNDTSKQHPLDYCDPGKGRGGLNMS